MNALTNPFGEVKTDTGAGALAQLERREEAEIMAMVAVAKRFPRDERAATEKIGRAFERHTLAEDAIYSYSRGGQEISDLNIRAMECIAAAWGNMDVSWSEVSRGTGDDGVPFSLVEAKAWDLETTTRKRIQFIVRHWRDKRNGQGYILKDERDIYELCANMAQRRVRACIGALIPEDIKEYARRTCDATLAAKAEVTADSIKALLEAFAEYKVTKDHIEKRLQRNIEAMQPGQLVRMRKIYRGLREGVSKPSDFFEGFEEKPAGDGPTTLSDITAKANPPAATPAPTPAPTQTPASTPAPATDLAGSPLSAAGAAVPNIPEPDALIEKMKKARNQDALAVYGDWIRHYADPAVKQRLTDHFEARMEELQK